MKAWQFCTLTAFIYVAPHVPVSVGVICVLLWLASAALWWAAEK